MAKAIQMPEEAVEFVINALTDSHKDKKTYHNRILSELQDDLKRVENRLEVMYLDRLDGKIDPIYYDKKHREWRREVEKIHSKMIKNNNANDCYFDEGVQLLELVQHAVYTYEMLDSSEKSSFLKIMHSNFIWKDGILTFKYRKPFDFIAEINAEYQKKMAVSREKNDHRPVWLPKRDAQQNFFVHDFKFLMVPLKRKHPRTEYHFQRA